jgi:hypothetical protein
LSQTTSTSDLGVMRIFIKTIAELFLALMLSGCVVGQHLDLEYAAAPQASMQEKNIVSVTVVDERPYVKNGDKNPWYIGQYRSGFGIPWDVSTDDKVPLADQFQEDLEKELKGLGFDMDGTPGNPGLHVIIKDWNFSTYKDGTFMYELFVTVRARDGTLIASRQLKSRHDISGTFWGGAKAGFEQKMPRIYSTIIQSVVRKNHEVLSALRS